MLQNTRVRFAAVFVSPLACGAWVIFGAAVLGYAINALATAGRPQFTSSNTPSRTAGKILPELRFDAVPAREVIAFLSETIGTRIDVDWAALRLSPEQPITLRLRNVWSMKVLELVADQLGDSSEIQFTERDGALHLTDLRDPTGYCERLYDIRDLCVRVDADDQAQIDLINEQVRHLLSDAIDPETWATPSRKGGEIRFDGGWMIVRHHPVVQIAIAGLIEKLRETGAGNDTASWLSPAFHRGYFGRGWGCFGS